MTPETPTAARPARAPRPEAPGYRSLPAWAALGAAAFTWPLLFVGGLVTTYRVGMAVPDWPTTFGINMFLYNMYEASFGVLVEHGHRLYGAAVGVFTIVLMVDLLAFDRRRWVKTLGVFALLAVIGQGVLGGIRVQKASTLLAMVHGTTGQAFFALMALLVAVTARSWFVRRRPVDPGRARGLAWMAGLALMAAYLQVVLGAWLRHFPSVGALGLHAGSALAVIGLTMATHVAVARGRDEWPGLVGPSRAMATLLLVQIALGVGSWLVLRPFDGRPHAVTNLAAFVRTAHQANAALFLGACVLLLARLAGGAAGVPIAGNARSASPTAPTRSSQTSPGLEVVA